MALKIQAIEENISIPAIFTHGSFDEIFDFDVLTGQVRAMSETVTC